MHLDTVGPMVLRMELEQWPRATPVRITGYSFDVINVVAVTLEKNGYVGRGEADGVYYKNETAASIAAQIERCRGAIEAGIGVKSLQELLPPCSARNALDCALWDLEAKLTGRPAWRTAGLETPKPLITTFTCHADDPNKMAGRARAFPDARAIKLKLTGEHVDAARIRAVRESVPDVWLGVDANQGFTPESLDWLMPTLIDERVALVEQPFPIGQEAWLDHLQSPIPIAADESVQGLTDVKALVGRVNVVNIKLDKCGGLTEALEMARYARSLGMDVMVGNMSGTSLAMAPAFLVGQLCDVVDLDGPILLKSDRPVGVEYLDGRINCPERLWGNPE